MEKIYKLLTWLCTEQAVDWLQYMTGTPVTDWQLLQLCDAGQCAAYVNANGLTGSNFDNFEDVILSGMHKLDRATSICRTVTAEADMLIPTTTKAADGTTVVDWVINNFPAGVLGHWFKPADIEALAAKMNGVPDQASLTAENADLRRSLAESTSEIAVLRQKLMSDSGAEEVKTAELESLRKQLEQARNLFIEKETALLDERSRADRNDFEFATLASKYKKLQQKMPTGDHLLSQSKGLAVGLTFPYATRELEAMRAAALKYWANHTPDKRQPTQVEIQGELCKLLGLPLMNDNSPPRKAVELAAAIKPSATPDA